MCLPCAAILHIYYDDYDVIEVTTTICIEAGHAVKACF